MLYKKIPTELPGAFSLQEATLEDYNALIPDDIKVKLAEDCLLNQIKNSSAYTSPSLTKKYIAAKISTNEREIFGIMILDAQHRLISDEILFKGTVDAASVYPREVVKCMLRNNGVACIFYHNHPSGIPTPSEPDKTITKRLVEALDLVGCRVLDHIIVGIEGQYSFAEHALI
ncbi:hypothetical protein NTH44_003337 [Vibrio metoecus]|nr:hypothetical protein [Vibrio cholerae]